MMNIWVAKEPRDISAIRVGVHGLSKCVGRVSVLCNLNFFVEEGELLGLVGPSGSTVLDVLAGKTTPTFGRITLDGKDVTALGSDVRNNLGIVRVLRPGELFSEMTALENIALSISWPAPFYSRRGGMTCWDAASAMLDTAGLAARRDTRVGSLSTYEQCLLALAIALAGKPSLLLLDSPADALTRVEQIRLGVVISDARYASGVSVLIADRDISSPLHFCDRLLVLSQEGGLANDVPWRMAGYLEGRRSAAMAALSPASDPLPL